MKLLNEKNTSFLLRPAPRVRIGLPRVSDRLIEALFFGGDPLLRYLDNSNPATLEKYKQKLQSFIDSFDSKYPPIRGLTKSAATKPRAFRRLFAAFLLYLTMRESIFLHALGMDGLAIVDAYSVVERFVSRSVLKRAPVGETSSKKLHQMIERASLLDLAEILRERGILNDDDITTIRRLKRLRDGIAHRNQQTISNLLFPGKTISPFDIPRIASRADTPSIILASLGLTLKITESIDPKRFRRFMQRRRSLRKTKKNSRGKPAR